jgi:hypothetical protein
MKMHRTAAMLLVSGVILQGLMAAASGGASVADDPYAPLKLYDGKWDVAMAGEKVPTRLENHCAKTGLFFACEQVVNGKTGALVIFLPFAKTASGGEEYRTQALRADASPAGDWGKLTIEGDKWVYAWESTDAGKKVYWRNINLFSETDKIHFEIQRSDDGSAWKTQNSGDEQRAK